MGVVVEVEQLRCARCSSLFVLCTSCFRGQAYCGPICRTASSRELHRAANARHQEDDDGRLDHRDRQRAYRERQLTAALPVVAEAEAVAGRSVTDSASAKLDLPMESAPAATVFAPRSLYASHLLVIDDDDCVPVAVLRCCVCGVVGTHIVQRRSRAPP